MPFDRIDTLILRRLPRKGQEWTHYPIRDMQCVEALDLLVTSGCVERRARAAWLQDGGHVAGLAVLRGNWRQVFSSARGIGFALDPAELQGTFIRPTSLGIAIREDLFSGTSLTQSHAIQFIRHMCIPGSIALFMDEDLTRMADPHPFEVTPHPIDPTIYPDYEI
jgi:hypothetical protein